MRYFFFAFETHDTNYNGSGSLALEVGKFPSMIHVKELIRLNNKDFAKCEFHITSIFEFRSKEDYENFIAE